MRGEVSAIELQWMLGQKRLLPLWLSVVAGLALMLWTLMVVRGYQQAARDLEFLGIQLAQYEIAASEERQAECALCSSRIMLGFDDANGSLRPRDRGAPEFLHAHWQEKTIDVFVKEYLETELREILRDPAPVHPRRLSLPDKVTVHKRDPVGSLNHLAQYVSHFWCLRMWLLARQHDWDGVCAILDDVANLCHRLRSVGQYAELHHAAALESDIIQHLVSCMQVSSAWVASPKRQQLLARIDRFREQSHQLVHFVDCEYLAVQLYMALRSSRPVGHAALLKQHCAGTEMSVLANKVPVILDVYPLGYRLDSRVCRQLADHTKQWAAHWDGRTKLLESVDEKDPRYWYEDLVAGLYPRHILEAGISRRAFQNTFIRSFDLRMQWYLVSVLLKTGPPPRGERSEETLHLWFVDTLGEHGFSDPASPHGDELQLLVDDKGMHLFSRGSDGHFDGYTMEARYSDPDITWWWPPLKVYGPGIEVSQP